MIKINEKSPKQKESNFMRQDFDDDDVDDDDEDDNKI